MRALICIVPLALACGGHRGLPPPPEYTPTHSPETETSCPAEWKEAKAAREALLEFEDASHQERAAAAVMAHGECERDKFDTLVLQGETQDRMTDQIRAARLQYQNAKNLYGEVANYSILRYTIGSRARLGELHLAFADKLRAAHAPPDIREPNQRAAFSTELGSGAKVYDREAVTSFLSCLQTAELVPSLVTTDAAVQAWVGVACKQLAFLDRAAHGNQKLCR